MKRRKQTVFDVFPCVCGRNLHTRGNGFMGGSWHGEWFMLKDRVWKESQRKGPCRLLCVGCVEKRIGRKLTHTDFRRSAKVNFHAQDQHSARLRRRMRGLKPAKRLVETTFKL